MNKLVLTGLVCTSLILATPDECMAHGGQYRGPGDVVPPNPGGSGGRTPGPSGPTTPGPSGPSTPGPSTPSTPGPSAPSTGGGAPSGGGGAGPITGGRGAPIGNDLTKWQFWWEFNKDPFLNLRAAIHAGAITTGSDEFFMGGSRRADATDTMKPTESDILETVLPSLKRALESTDQRDIVSSCLVAMGKIGKDHKDFKILPLMKEALKIRDQEVRETAAVAMGISQMTEAIPDLVALALDTERGRELCDRSSVDNRTASFACYGLGLIAYATNNVDHKRQCFEALRKILVETTEKGVADRNLPVAAINGIRLIRPNPQGSAEDEKLLAECVDVLWNYYQKKAGQGEQLIQAHVPPAIAQLLGRGGDRDGKFKEAFARELGGGARRAITIYQSAALALGQLCEPQEVNKDDKKYSDLLVKYFGNGKDQQARYFCTIALAMIGGNANRNALLKILDRGNKALEKPWAAISLGVLAFNDAEAKGDSAVLDTAIGRALHKELTSNKNDQTQAAMAVALGLVKYRQAADDIEAMLIKNKNRDELAGYLCIGLALMNNKRSIETIRGIVQNSIRRPGLLQQAAIALGKMGDKTVTEDLQKMLRSKDNQSVAKLSALASALGFIGDRRTIEPLTQMLHDDSITELSRAFAAVALGGVADKEPLPWNSKIAVGMNYRAAVETLTNQQSGVLDIL